MASLYIDARRYVGRSRIRQYRIILDGVEVARIGRNDGIRLPALAGRHSLRAKIDWCISKEVNFELADHEERRFEVGSNITLGRMLVSHFALIYRDDYLYLRKIYPVGYSPYGTADPLH